MRFLSRARSLVETGSVAFAERVGWLTDVDEKVVNSYLDLAGLTNPSIQRLREATEVHTYKTHAPVIQVPATASGSPKINSDLIAARIEPWLAANRRFHTVLVVVTAAIFGAGVAVILMGFVGQNPYVIGAGILWEGILYWPVREFPAVRREQMILQTVPVIVSTLRPSEAAAEIRKLLQLSGHGDQINPIFPREQLLKIAAELDE
jgi:hypothetical protein